MESESDPLTLRPIDLFEKEPLKGNFEVDPHTPTKFGEDPSKDLGGDREHTHKRCSNYSMMMHRVYIVLQSRKITEVNLSAFGKTDKVKRNLFVQEFKNASARAINQSVGSSAGWFPGVSQVVTM